MSLRMLLVLIGVAIIVGVYVVTAAKRRRDTRVRFDRRFSSLDVPDVILHHDEEEGVAEAASAKTPPPLPKISRLGDDVVLPPEDISLDELPRVVNELDDHDEPTNARRGSDQLDLFGAAAAKSSRVKASRAAPAAVAEEVADDGLVKLFVRARDKHPFRGVDVVRGLNSVGMTHGEMSIFHHYGAGELRCDKPIFSAANMFEPGTFDLNRIEAFQTAGIVLFMQLPTPLDGPVAFELLLNTAQRLSEIISGEIFVTPQARLDSRTIATLRQRAQRFSNAGE